MISPVVPLDGGQSLAHDGLRPPSHVYDPIVFRPLLSCPSGPVECADVVGTLLRDLGPDYVLWGLPRGTAIRRSPTIRRKLLTTRVA
jgi:hypothetical protein